MTVSTRFSDGGIFFEMLTPSIEPAEQYLLKFHWNKVKYRADKPLGEIIDTLQKVALPTAFMLLDV